MGAASTSVADCVVSDTCTATNEAVPVSAGRSGVTVRIAEGWDCCEPPEPDPLFEEPCAPEPVPAGAGPSAVILPGVVALVGSTIETASPTLTTGRFGSTGTVTTRVVVVVWYGTSPEEAVCPIEALAAPTRTEPGRNTTCPNAICPSAG